MRSTVILAINNEENIIPSILSVIESEKKPNNFCIAMNLNVSDNIKGVVNAFLKSCCDGSEYREEYNKDSIVAKKIQPDFIITSIISGNPIKDSYKSLKGETDVFFTMRGNTRYDKSYIDKIMSSFDNMTGLVYSDFVFNGKRIYLESLNLNNIPEIAFRKEILSDDPAVFDCADIIRAAYSKSIVRHIPQALYAL